MCSWNLLYLIEGPPTVFLFFCTALLVPATLFVLRPRSSRALEGVPVAPAAYLFLAATTLLYLYWSVLYLRIPVYFDHVEPAVANVTMLVLRGQPMYPDWEAGEGLYGIVYGPLLYALHACVLFAVKTIFGTKLAGVLAIWAALLAMAADSLRSARSAPVAALALGCVLLFLARFGHYGFWSRPEPFLVLVTALSVQALRLERQAAAIAVGTLAGIAVGLKPFAALLVAPALLALIVRRESFRAMLGTAAVAAVCAVLIAVAPYLHPGVNPARYLDYLMVTARHGFSLDLLHESVVYLAIMAAPLAVVWYLRRPVWTRESRWFAFATLACLLAVVAIGAKNGAGSHYILPGLPLVLHLTLRTAAAAPSRAGPRIGGRATAMCCFVPYVFALGPLAFGNSCLIDAWANESGRVQAAVGELGKIWASYPRAEMGASDEANYPWTYYRVTGVMQGTPVHLDLAFLMDLRSAGLGGEATAKLVENCRVGEWILPVNGVPFSQYNNGAYGGMPLFTREFRQAFEQHYRPVFKGSYYSVWSCSEGISGKR